MCGEGAKKKPQVGSLVFSTCIVGSFQIGDEVKGTIDLEERDE